MLDIGKADRNGFNEESLAIAGGTKAALVLTLAIY
jgi:hypothetical protein